MNFAEVSKNLDKYRFTQQNNYVKTIMLDHQNNYILNSIRWAKVLTF